MSQSVAAQKKWFGHPRGLSTLFFTEMWERFSYYGMRGLLLLFLVASVETGGFGMTDRTAAAIYGLYVSSVYLLALPGGWIADRILGQRRAVFVGGCIIAAGHFSMALPTVPSFYLGLCLIACGTGLLKPNVSAIVGDLYPEGGARRDAGFSVFYSGINLGAFIGPLVCGFLGEHVDWHLGFGAAGIGMVLGLIQYQRGGKYLADAGMRREDAATAGARAGAVRKLAVGAGAFAALALTAALLQRTGILHLTLPGVARKMGVVIVAIAILYFASILLFGGLTKAEKKRVVVLFLFFVASALFWAGYEQAGSSLNLFASRMTDRMFGGWEMPASWFQSVPPIYVILLAPVFGWIWLKLGSREPSMPAKFGYGLVFLSLGFLVMVAAASATRGGSARVGPGWLVMTYFIHTVGELCLSPVGLSSVTKLAPRRLVSQLMGTFFMGNALGNLIAGLAAGGFSEMPLQDLFGTAAKVAGAAGLILLLFARPIRSLIGQLPSAVPAPAKAVPESGSVPI
ncbi:MAG: peptide MFS transporter [Thermoanaerobaculia bacterium]